MLKYTYFLLILFFLACSSGKMPTSKKELSSEKLSYLALGDSYTIGESVAEAERWPNQLADALEAKGIQISKPKIIAKTGWRTDELLNTMVTELEPKLQYDLVSVLIGVNNQFQNKAIETYKIELGTLLNQAILLSKKGKKNVFVLSIPDYGATPFGKSNSEEIGMAINQWNTVCEAICKEKGITYFNITDISRQGMADATLVASDGLHPSGKMYKLWVERIIKAVELLCR